MDVIQEQSMVPKNNMIREQDVKQALYAAVAVGEAILEYGGEDIGIGDDRFTGFVKTARKHAVPPSVAAKAYRQGCK